MKTFRFIAGAAFLMFAASCTKHEDPSADGNEPVMVQKSFSAYIDGAETKTSLVDGKKVHWTAGDAISVFDDVGNKNNIFESSEVDGSYASFSGYTVDGATEYVAVYPYKYGATYADDVITTTVPLQQKAIRGSFDNNLNISVARSSDEQQFSFKNACALLKVTIPDGMTDVTAISVAAGTYLSGKVLITMAEDGSFTVAGSTATRSAFKEVNLDNNGEAMEPGDYYIVVIPGTHASRFHLGVTTTDGETYVKYKNLNSDNDVTINPNDVINLGDVPASGSKDFKVTDLPTGPVSVLDTWTLGYEIGEGYTGKSLAWSSRNSDIATAVTADTDNQTATVTFGKKVGPVMVYATYDGVNYPVNFDVRPLYKDNFSGFNNVLSSGAAATVKSDCLEVTTNTSGDGNLSTEGLFKAWVAPSLAPILCVRLEDPRDIEDVKSATIGLNLYKNFEFNGSGGTFRKTLSGAEKFALEDGTSVLIWDLREDAAGTAGVLPEDFMADGYFRLLVEKITDTSGNRVQKTYRFYGFSSFVTLEEAKSHYGIID